MYKWQKKQWENIIQRRHSLPHAFLVRGRAGIGKHDFAYTLSKALLCRTPVNQQACDACPSCIWFAEGHHPDFRLITPEEAEVSEDAPKKKAAKKGQISVTQVRQLFDYLNLSKHQAQSMRIILISPAETFNAASANALLKMLEEPPANTLFLLVSSQSQRLLPTIVSRCQSLDMELPGKVEALAWLEQQGVGNAEVALAYAGGAPLLALSSSLEDNRDLTQQLAQGAKLKPFVAAPMFMSMNMERALEILQKWIFDLMSYQLSRQFHYHLEHSAALQALCKSVNLRLLLRFQQTLVEAKKTANHPLSNEMQLENLLLQYTYIFKG